MRKQRKSQKRTKKPSSRQKRRSNPFTPPLLADKDKLKEALAVLQKIEENVTANKAKTTASRRQNPYSPVWDQTVMDSPAEEELFGYNGSFLTPLNLVANSVDPKTSNKLLKLLLEGDQPGEVADFYSGAVGDIEKISKTIWNEGNLPPTWFDPVTMDEFTTVPSPADRVFKHYNHTPGRARRTLEQFREDLGSLSAAQRRRLRKYR